MDTSGESYTKNYAKNSAHFYSKRFLIVLHWSALLWIRKKLINCMSMNQRKTFLGFVHHYDWTCCGKATTTLRRCLSQTHASIRSMNISDIHTMLRVKHFVFRLGYLMCVRCVRCSKKFKFFRLAFSSQSISKSFNGWAPLQIITNVNRMLSAPLFIWRCKHVPFFGQAQCWALFLYYLWQWSNLEINWNVLQSVCSKMMMYKHFVLGR